MQSVNHAAERKRKEHSPPSQPRNRFSDSGVVEASGCLPTVPVPASAAATSPIAAELRSSSSPATTDALASMNTTSLDAVSSQKLREELESHVDMLRCELDENETDIRTKLDALRTTLRSHVQSARIEVLGVDEVLHALQQLRAQQNDIENCQAETIRLLQTLQTQLAARKAPQPQ